MLALPARLGGLAITIPSMTAESEHKASLDLTASLVSCIKQKTNHQMSTGDMRQIKVNLRQKRVSCESERAKQITQQLPEPLRYTVQLASEKGASSWLTALPVQEHGFSLHKGTFRDVLSLRYGWTPERLPSHCVCGQQFHPDHALSCPTGAFPTRRHNEIRDLLATLISEVCFNTAIEPLLQPLTGETFRRQATTTDDEARLDIRARGFWGNQAENTFFDVNIFNPNAPSNRTSSLSSCYRRHERAKRNKYEERILEVERASFTPLVFNTSGGASPLTTTFLKHLASLLAEKRDLSYSTVLGWLRARLNFSLLRAAITCIRGSRSKVGHACHENIPDLAVSETQLSLH